MEEDGHLLADLGDVDAMVNRKGRKKWAILAERLRWLWHCPLPKGREEKGEERETRKAPGGLAVPVPVPTWDFPEGLLEDPPGHIHARDPTETTEDGAGGGRVHSSRRGHPPLPGWTPEGLRPEVRQGERVFPDMAGHGEQQAEDRKADL